MSNIFNYLARPTGRLHFHDTPAAVPEDQNQTQHLTLDGTGSIYVDTSGVIDHYGAGLPFTSSGALVVSSDPVDRIGEGGIPFTAGGAVAFS